MTLYIGVDPGLDGGIVALDGDGEIVGAHVMPTLERKVSGRKRKIERVVDVSALKLMFSAYAHNTHVCIEKQHAMRKQGLASTFKTGYGYGAVVGLARALIDSFDPDEDIVRATDWQRACLSGTQEDMDTKARALEAAEQIWPDQSWLATTRSKKAHSGLVDAALIARWCWQRHKFEMAEAA